MDVVQLVESRTLPDQQALGLDDEDDRDDTQQNADAHRADRVPDRVTGQHRQPDSAQRENQTEQRSGILQQHDGKLRGLGLPDELPPGAVSLERPGLPDRGAKAQDLQPDRHYQDDDRDQWGGERLVGLQLVKALVEREHRPEAEQQQRTTKE